MPLEGPELKHQVPLVDFEIIFKKYKNVIQLSLGT